MSGLIPIEQVNALELFSGQALDDLLAKIRQETATLIPDVATDKGRKEIASIAYKIARSKTAIDEAGKELVSEWKRKSGEVDAARKKARDYLDALKDEVRKPLTDWEEDQARIEREKAEAEARKRAEEEAARLAEIERREAEIRAKEEEIRRAEQERIAKERAEQEAKERAEREERIRREAEERAKRDAEEAVQRAEREAAAAIERERQAAERAQREKEEAVRAAELRAKQEAEAKERARAQEEARAKEEDRRRAEDRENRRKVNSSALKAFVEEGIEEEIAKRVISLIAAGSIPSISIRY